MSLSALTGLLVLGIALADKPSSGYGAPAIPQVKYGGPIVYSAEKPPIIHFPPPPAEVSTPKLSTLYLITICSGSIYFVSYLKYQNFILETCQLPFGWWWKQ